MGMKVDETTLDDLIEAHRALAARHEALFQICRALLPAIPCALPMKMRLIDAARGSLLDQMQLAQYDAEYQQAVLRSIELLAGTILLDVASCSRPH